MRLCLARLWSWVGDSKVRSAKSYQLKDTIKEIPQRRDHAEFISLPVLSSSCLSLTLNKSSLVI